MKIREFVVAAGFSLMLGVGLILALGGSRILVAGRSNEAGQVTASASLPVPSNTPSNLDTPTPSATPVAIPLAGEEPSSAPVIDMWQGNTQNFGFFGNPQAMINLLGNVLDADGISSLKYSLNGGPEKRLCIASVAFPTCDPIFRLVSPGDFNIEIDVGDLSIGQNTVHITASDSLSNQSTVAVTVQYSGGNTWPMPYVIDWNAVTRISDVAQIVDGKWILETNSVRPAVTGYDRTIAVGDILWDDYEVTVPITIHGFPESRHGLVGITTRWQGHFVTDQEQPGFGWWNLGALGFFQSGDSQNGGPALGIHTGQYDVEKDYEVELDFGKPYYFKMRVESKSPGQGGHYSFKVWEVGQAEPSKWHFEIQDTSPNQLLTGSLLLVAHRTDASFGDIVIVPLADLEAPGVEDESNEIGS